MGADPGGVPVNGPRGARGGGQVRGDVHPAQVQVYLPLLQASLPPAEIAPALEATLREPDRPLDLGAMLDNRLAMNGLMRDFCAQEGIEFLDLTEALQARVARGQNVYFPDDSHWNAAGHETASEALEVRLRASQPVQACELQGR